MGRGEALTVTIPSTGETNIWLVYDKEGDTERKSYIQYVSDFGMVLHNKLYAATDTFPSVEPPVKLGYTFQKWIFADNEAEKEEVTAEKIRRRILDGKHKVITVKPLYNPDDSTSVENPTVTVQYKYDGEIRDDETTPYTDTPLYEKRAFNAAPEKDGYVFQYWKEGDTILSYKNDLYVMISGDRTLTAEYGKEKTEEVPVITLSELGFTETEVVVDGVTKTTYKIHGTATRSIPEGYELIRHGMLYAWDVTDHSDEWIRIGRKDFGVFEYESSKTTLYGTVTLHVKVLNENEEVTLRGYMVLRDKNGDLMYCYSDDIRSGSVQSISQGLEEE